MLLLNDALLIQNQGGVIDAYNNSNVPFNTVAVHLSQKRSLLSIVNFSSENVGIYKCNGVSIQDAMSFELVSISIGKFIESCNVLFIISDSSLHCRCPK